MMHLWKKRQASQRANKHRVAELKGQKLIKPIYSHDERRELVAAGFVRELWRKVIKNKIDLPPDDILKLIAIWIHLMDSWDATVTHPNIIISYENNVECIERKQKMDTVWYHCYGTDIIKKGMKKRWTFQFLKVAMSQSVSVIGIINDEFVDPHLLDFVITSKYGGYGLSTVNHQLCPGGTAMYNSYVNEHSYIRNTKLSMELDMTKSNSATLAYLVNGGKDEIMTKRNIAWDNIDINKKYRLCISFYRSNSKIALVQST